MVSTMSNFNVFLLCGQSNMSGRGGVHERVWDNYVPVDCRAEKGSVLRFTADQKWEEAQEPLHVDIDTTKVCGVGPGLPFATSLLHHLMVKKGKECTAIIGVVPCAIGSTCIKEWQKGEKLYENMISRAKSALQKGGSLKALLWYQGESDITSADDVELYQSRLEKFILDVRSDLGTKDLPIIQVGITWDAYEHPTWLQGVRDAQRAITIPGVFYVDALGLPLQEDLVHLTTEAQVRLGRMLADVYVKRVIDSPSQSLEN